MLPIEEIDYSFPGEFKSQTNIQELQSRNINTMFMTSFSLIHFKSLFYEFFWKTGKGVVVHHRKMCYTKSLSLVNTANSVRCKYTFLIFLPCSTITDVLPLRRIHHIKYNAHQ